MNESNPPPEPTSTTFSPGSSRPSENGLPTPANDSAARSGSAPTRPASYPSRAARGRPVWKWKLAPGSTATSRYLPRTCSRSASGSTSSSSSMAHPPSSATDNGPGRTAGAGPAGPGVYVLPGGAREAPPGGGDRGRRHVEGDRGVAQRRDMLGVIAQPAAGHDGEPAARGPGQSPAAPA